MMTFHLERRLLVLAGILISLVLLAPSCKRARSIEIPKDLGGMKMVQHLSGAQAKQMINHLHGKGVAPQENHVAFFGDGRYKATLYVSRYSDESEANSMEKGMAARIAAGNPVFSEYEVVSFSSQQLSRCVGMGQIHFFFARDAELYWLSADRPCAQQALDDLLR